jgi:uncharacterized damage-inducible protein DinB
MKNRAMQELLYGSGAHVDPTACLEDVAEELAGRMLQGFPHTIWQIVGHLNYWIDYDLRRIGGGTPTYPVQAIESWPSSRAPASDEQWQDELRRFASLLDEVKTLAASDAEVLQRHVAATHASHDAISSSVEAVLWQTIVHNSYHIGQVALLRRCFGAWPPRRGSDTW